MTKVIERHLWEEFREYADEIRHTMEWKEIYPQRKETIERVFADCKENNGLRFTRLKGLKKNQQNAWLIFACHNLKKMSLWRGKYRRKPSKSSTYPSKYPKKTISFWKLPIYNKKPMSLRKGIGFCQQSERKIESSFFFDLNVKQSQLCYSDIYTICTQHIKTLSYKTDNVYIDKKT